jgi:hypothetical protein
VGVLAFSISGLSKEKRLKPDPASAGLFQFSALSTIPPEAGSQLARLHLPRPLLLQASERSVANGYATDRVRLTWNFEPLL